MLKKSLIAAGAVVLFLGLAFGRDGWSYLKTSLSRVRSQVKDNVPVTFELDRARKMIKDLDPEIRSNMHLIAKEEVEIDRLEKQLAASQTNLKHDRENILRLKNDLDGAQKQYTYGGRKYSIEEVKADLSNRFDRYKTAEGTNDKTDKILAARKQGLVSARQKLEGMLSAKRQLEVDVENLEARQKMIEVAQTSSDFNFDDSHLARTKELLSEIGVRLEVAERLVNTSTSLQGQIPLDEPKTTDGICDEVAQYFGEGGKSDQSQVADARK